MANVRETVTEDPSEMLDDLFGTLLLRCNNIVAGNLVGYYSVRLK